MSISAPFIARPIATSLLAVAVLLSSMLAYSYLPISSLPQVDFPVIQVTTQLPGANADTMSRLITAPLERQLGQIPSLETMSSSSSQGLSQITLQFALDRDINAAGQDVQSAISAAGGQLPQNLPYPPTYAKVNPSDPPVLTLALTSTGLSMERMSDLADTFLSPQLSQVTGVGRVTVQGNIRPAVRIQANPTQLSSYGLALETVRAAIANSNVTGSKGLLSGPDKAFLIGANDQLETAKAYEQVVVSYSNGAPVLLRDVATIKAGLENEKVAARYNGVPAVIIDVQRQPGANIVGTVDLLKNRLPQLLNGLPSGVNVEIAADRTGTIRASVHDVQFTLGLSVVLVVLVVLLFLRTLSATAVAGVTLPLSLIASFGIMYFAGFSLDNLSLMALTIATGFVVDDAIVMIENIMRHIENGEKPMVAAYKGAGEIGFTIVSLTVSLIAVFIPLLFMTGIVGPAVPRIRADADDCGADLNGHRADAHPHDERPAAARGSPWQARTLVRADHRGAAECADRFLPRDPRHCAALPEADAARGGAHARPHGLALPRHPQRVPAGPGHWLPDGGHRNSARCFLRAHEGVAEGGRGRDPQGPGCTRRWVRGWHQHHERNAEHRAFRPDAQAQERAAGDCHGDHTAAGKSGARNSGHLHDLPDRAGYPDRHGPEQHTISIRAGWPRPARLFGLGQEAHRRT